MGATALHGAAGETETARPAADWNTTHRPLAKRHFKSYVPSLVIGSRVIYVS